jgi:hypothetical protein
MVLCMFLGCNDPHCVTRSTNLGGRSTQFLLFWGQFCHEYTCVTAKILYIAVVYVKFGISHVTLVIHVITMVMTCMLYTLICVKWVIYS